MVNVGICQNNIVYSGLLVKQCLYYVLLFITICFLFGILTIIVVNSRIAFSKGTIIVFN